MKEVREREGGGCVEREGNVRYLFTQNRESHTTHFCSILLLCISSQTGKLLAIELCCSTVVLLMSLLGSAAMLSEIGRLEVMKRR